MPNWCSCSVSVTDATPEQIQRIVDACTEQRLLGEYAPQPDWSSTPNEDGVLPGPRYMVRYRNGRIGVDAPRFPDGTADERWYYWRNDRDNWGTKWEPDCEISDRTDTSVDIFFNSAWCPPSDIWFAKLSTAMPNAAITNIFDEEGCDFCGIQYAIKGTCFSRHSDITSIRDTWIEKDLSPEDKLVSNNPTHERYDEVLELIYERWNECGWETVNILQEKMLDEMKTLSLTL